MQTIESITLMVYAEFPSMLDTDVEFAYENIKAYYKALATGKEPEEPLSTSDRRQALMDEILNAIDDREELEADLHVINNPNIQPSGKMIKSLPAFYMRCMGPLVKSVRFWRKENGKRGYLSFIAQMM